MKAEKTHILLIAYSFPPYPGIGGRRWAKFAKYLTRNDYIVHVICASNPFPEVSLWTADVMENPDIKIHHTKPFYPQIFDRRPPLSNLEKFRYHFWLKALPLFVRGTIFDKAMLWKDELLNIAPQLIRKHAIRNVIVTGAPFRALYHSTLLKDQFPALKMIADFRDPWTEGKSYGFGGLSEKRKKQEMEMEAEVCRKADIIVSPAETILDYLKTQHPIVLNKTVLLPHAFDDDEFKKALSIERSQTNRSRIIYSGTIYEDCESYFNSVFDSISSMKIETPELYSGFQLDFYTTYENKIRELLKGRGLNEKVNFHRPLNPEDLFCEMADSEYVLVVFIEKYKNYLSTKFYEMINLNKFIIYLGPKGDVSEFITSNKLGVAIDDLSQVDRVLKDLIVNKRASLPFPRIKEFSYAKVNEKLIKLFN